MYRTDAEAALETAVHILEALQKAREAQRVAEEAIAKAQGQISDIESSLDSVRIVSVSFLFSSVRPARSSGVIRIVPLRFLAGCRKRRLDQALSVLSLNLGLF